MRSDIVFLLCVCPVLDRKLVDGVKFGVVAIIVQGISSRCISLNTQKARTDIVFVDKQIDKHSEIKLHVVGNNTLTFHNKRNWH